MLTNLPEVGSFVPHVRFWQAEYKYAEHCKHLKCVAHCRTHILFSKLYIRGK
jgi:hypothetical protein